jgi:hypothetical protein
MLNTRSCVHMLVIFAASAAAESVVRSSVSNEAELRAALALASLDVNVITITEHIALEKPLIVPDVGHNTKEDVSSAIVIVVCPEVFALAGLQAPGVVLCLRTHCLRCNIVTKMAGWRPFALGNVAQLLPMSV